MPSNKATLDDMLGSTGHGPDDVEQPMDEVEKAAGRSTFTKKQFDSSETATLRLTLAQGLSPEVRDRKANVGDFLVTGLEPVQEVILVLGGHATKRRYVPAGEQRAQCYSSDGVQGNGNPGILCEACPLSKWTPKPDGSGNAAPPCAEIDAFQVFSITHGMPMEWQLKGTAAKAARQLKSWLNGFGWDTFAVKVTAEAREGKGRKWHEPVVQLVKDYSVEDCMVFAAMARGETPAAASLPAS